MSQSPQPTIPRVVWVAGTRGEILLLGEAFAALHRAPRPACPGWLLATGEHGMAATQALDFLGLHPDDFAELCHPADEPAVRLTQMLERVEAFGRRRRATHVVFSGYGATAAAAAIYCHARKARGLWLRPPDPAGVIARLRWESGLVRMIEACAPVVEIRELPAMTQRESAPAGETYGAFGALEEEIPGRHPGAPLALIAVWRREWGIASDVTDRLALAARDWATAHPEADYLLISNLNARLEGPLRALDPRPANLLVAPPLPYPVWRAALSEARLVLTDSPLVAAEALASGAALATLGEIETEQKAVKNSWRDMTPRDFHEAAWLEFQREALSARRSAEAPAAEVVRKNEASQIIADWLA